MKAGTPPPDPSERVDAVRAPAPAMDGEEFRRLAHAAVDWVADYLAAIPRGPSSRP